MAGQGQINTFADTVTTRRTIANLVHFIDPLDVPCISYFGTANQSRFNMLDWPNHKYAWLEDTLRVRTATISDASGVSGTTATLGVAAGHGIRFKPGDVWQTEEGDLLWVDSISTDSLTVIPNWAAANGGTQGTWTTTIADAGTLTYKYSARLEGDDSDPSHWVTPVEVYNQSQIMHAELRVSGSEDKATTRYGITNSLDYQLKKLLGGAGAGGGRKGRAGDLMIDLENTFFSGQRVARSSTAAGAMGGFPYFVTTNVDDNSGVARTLTQPMLENMLQTIWEAGGMPDVIICNAFQKRMINSFYTGSVRTDRSEKLGGSVIDSIVTDFGTYELLLNRRADPDKLFIAQKDKVGWVTLRDWAIKPLAESGDYTKKEITGEFGFVVVNEEAHGIIKDLTTSA